MKNIKFKIRVILFFIVISILFFVVNTSYASFTSSTSGNAGNIQFAKFNVNNYLSDEVNFDISGMRPGISKKFTLNVSNTTGSVTSDVTIKYKIYVSSNVLPYNYSLYKGNNTTNLLTCSGGYNITCESSEQQLSYSTTATQSYKLVVSIPETRSDNESFSFYYANSIDTISLSINSWQT